MTLKFHPDGTLPKSGEIFVFGSNLAGRHGKGAARVAYDRFGAIYGDFVGIQGNSYAIPTKDAKLKVLSLDEIEAEVKAFCVFARISNREFWLTAIGCGLAGYHPKQIAPMFDILPNIDYPDVFLPYLKQWQQNSSPQFSKRGTISF